MNGGDAAEGAAADRVARVASLRQTERQQWRQLALITAAAIAIYAGLRLLPTGTNLSHMDFRVDPKAGNAIEFCDPSNPQFIPVVSARSPVTMEIRGEGQRAGARGFNDSRTAGSFEQGREVRAVVTLRTSNGKPVAPEDLLVTHTKPLHLLVIDPTLRDYQHVHPTPGAASGEWAFAFTPLVTGTYRVFADFTPVATSRGLYASADMEIAAAATGESPWRVGGVTRGGSPLVAFGSSEIERDGVIFTLVAAQQPIRAKQPVDLRFAMRRGDGGVVPLQPVMGAYAHLVAFDQERSGFAHLHPVDADPAKAPAANHPELNFKLTIPRAGEYVVWAQVNIAGSEVFVPFAIEVKE